MDSESSQELLGQTTGRHKPRSILLRRLKNMTVRFILLGGVLSIGFIAFSTFKQWEYTQLEIINKINFLESENRALRAAFEKLSQKESVPLPTNFEDLEALKTRIQGLEDEHKARLPTASVTAPSEERLQFLEVLLLCHEIEKRIVQDQPYQDLITLLMFLIKTEQERAFLQKLKENPVQGSEEKMPRWLDPIRHLFSLTRLTEHETRESLIAKLKDYALLSYKDKYQKGAQ